MTTDVAEELSPSIAEILGMRPWKHALFTTYTLSLSYFESEILRPLLRAGCSDIWLISDAEGYRSSLLERRSMRVGQEYRLIPVAMPKGVFHAKCIYLGSEEGDLLLVGSGNVTFGGHGKNAEVFEALTPDQAATAFRDFADFLEAVGFRPDIAIAATDWIDDFAGRARIAAQGGDDAAGWPPLRLVHPLEEPVIDQLPAKLSPYGPCREAIVMSPYHDRDGLAVSRLCERLAPEAVSVAVPRGGVSPFPFSETSAWSTKVTPVVPGMQDARFVHAKWYEFAFDGGRVLLSGSINATRKSLTTSDNVELGVLRFLPDGVSPLTWSQAEPPLFEEQKRLPSGLCEAEIVYAAFDRHESRKLKGRLISLRPVAGQWDGRLIQADGETMPFDVAVDDDGNFSATAAGFEGFAEMPALQIALTQGDREARGWMHNEMFLSVQGRRRLTAGALSRLMRREGSDDDIEALLDYLSVAAEHHLRIFDRPVQKTADPKSDERGGATVTVNLVDLAPGAETNVGAPAGPAGNAGHDQLDAALVRLRRMMLGNGRSRHIPLQSQGADTLAEDESEGDRPAGPSADDMARKLGLAAFDRAIATMIEDAKEEPGVLRRILAMQLEVGMWFRLYRLDDKDAAHEFLRGWFARASRMVTALSVPAGALQQHVLTAAAILYRLAQGTGLEAFRAGELHDHLERFYGGPVERDSAFASLLPDPMTGFAAALLVEVAQSDIEGALASVLSQSTIRQQLTDAMTCAIEGSAPPADWPVFATPLGKTLHEAFGQPNWQRKIKPAMSGARACAFDQYSFRYEEASSFEKQRIARCIHCKKFTLNLKP